MPLLAGLTEPYGSLHFVFLDATPAFCVYQAKHELRIDMPLVGSLAIPHDCLCVVLRNASAFSVYSSEIVLGDSEPLVGRFTKPSDGLGYILLNALAHHVHSSKIVLGDSEPLVGSLAIPHDSLCVVLLNALTNLVSHTELELCLSIPPLGGSAGFAKFRGKCCVVRLLCWRSVLSQRWSCDTKTQTERKSGFLQNDGPCK